eukprot:13984178-Alexandrium_andersonii.AAC.1
MSPPSSVRVEAFCVAKFKKWESAFRLASRTPRAEDCAACGSADCGLEPASCDFAPSDPLEARF